MIYLILVNYSKVMQLVKVDNQLKLNLFKKKIIVEMESSSDDDDLDDSDDPDKESIEPIAVSRITFYFELYR